MLPLGLTPAFFYYFFVPHATIVRAADCNNKYPTFDHAAIKTGYYIFNMVCGYNRFRFLNVKQ